MDYLPIFMNLRGQRCLVVGGGEVAARKAALLLKAGARLRVVAPRLASPAHELLAARDDVELLRAPFNPGHLDGCVLAVAATDQQAVNRRVHALATARGVPVNVVDQPALCSFIFPAIVDRAPVTIAVSSGGAAPVLTRLLRRKLESTIPAGYGRLAALAGALRDKVRTRLDSLRARRLFWEQALEGPAAEAALAGDVPGAQAMLERELDGFGVPAGEVFLIGAGPGDPDLLTFKALRLLQKADVVVYDRLVPEAIVDLARREAERIYVGKRRGEHSLPQEDISRRLAELARQGKKVARLKGGDPFVFGRGGEEIETLAAAGVPFQVVPGITAASGCAAYAGIPLTHREHAQSVRFVTGHTRDGRLDLDWACLIDTRETLVFYMGLANLETICAELRAHGMAAETPAALIERGTLPGQRVHTGTLADLPASAAAAQAASPALLIVGGVVGLHALLGACGDAAQVEDKEMAYA
ncbi:siroheme synthase CysG [Acidihalobacter ferrooxydans]|uniref:Siroheme synthase n=1 Tax=Acidihalobacter ferrooxydans TaxID=1765967 RepID=A0A1P8UGA5_9GAMM|nr:siroheme synthase CysG [Acidihalobacter ferrooxydans]APZ42887.1 uroporphyrinogen-III C-methyltransferase [Acidihalobacter ferrooxydans]